MRKYFIYLMIYSFGGFILERIINVIFLLQYYDNSVLIGPYQPLYGAGILMAIIVYDLLLKRIPNMFIRYGLLLVVSIITTGISEATTGYGFEYFYNISLWDYNLFFSCPSQYVCIVPTSIFGVISFLVIVFIHPFIKGFVNSIPRILFRWVFRILLLVFVVDIFVTFLYRLA